MPGDSKHGRAAPEKERAARSGNQRGPQECGENSSEIIAQRRAEREAEDAFLAFLQARINAGRKPGFARLGDVLRALLDEAEIEVDATGGMHGQVRPAQRAASRRLDVALDALDRLEQGVQP